MKRLVLLAIALMSMITMLAQTTITLTFKGRDQHNTRVQLDNVTIQNVTRGWMEAIYFPDTIYTLTVGTGVADYLLNNDMQVMPNPFDGRTQINVNSAKNEKVLVTVVDINGKKCAEYNGVLSSGDNYFEIQLTTPQTYIMSVQTIDGIRSLKMVNIGSAGSNQIKEVGINNSAVQIKSTAAHIFELGDEMCYTGYSQQSNGLIPSTPITQNQYDDETITLLFVLENDAELPLVATVGANNVGTNSATTGGNVFSDGGASVTVRGVCYGVTPNPTLAENHTSDGTGTGAFTSNLTNLVENTTYYVRAYATNSMGTAYGNEVSFTTLSNGDSIQDGQPCPGCATVIDFDGNTYNTVQIGEQCWMKENLRVTHYSDGTSISTGNAFPTAMPYYYNYSSNLSLEERGYLYNWPAVINGAVSFNTQPNIVQGICPTGWHVPNDAEWAQLINYMSNQSQYVCDNDSAYIAKALASTSGWSISDSNCAVGNNQNSNNATGFSAFPAGLFLHYYDNLGNYSNSGNCAILWSSTEHHHSYLGLLGSFSGYICIEYLAANATIESCDTKNGLSVRCLRGEQDNNLSLPTVSTSLISDITDTSATCGGTVTNDGGSSIIARGACWSQFDNYPYVNTSNHTTDGSSAGNFISNISGLTLGTQYYVRAYATNNVGTAYGDVIIFHTRQCGTPEIRIVKEDSNSVYVEWDGYSDQHEVQYRQINESGWQTLYVDSLMNVTIPNLSPSTFYEVRVRANCENAVWSDIDSFQTTVSCPSTLFDYDGNTYNVVTLGQQCWMKENLRVTHYANGEALATCDTTNMTTPYYYTPIEYSTAYGKVYNWSAVMHGASSSTSNPSGVQGICPNGWHVPSYAEWVQLAQYVGSKNYYRCNEDQNTSIARALADTIEWYNSYYDHCDLGYDPHYDGKRNATGFSALPAGYVSYGDPYDDDVNNLLSSFGSRTYFWSSTDYSNYHENTALCAGLIYDSKNFNVYYNYIGDGFSVRCVKNNDSISQTLPMVTTSSVSYVTSSTAICGGNITSDGGATVTARGVCWSTMHDPTINSNHSIDGSDTGSFTSNITELLANTTYYVRAYATNSVGTVYGNEVSFTTLSSSGTSQDGQPCPNATTVTDIDGNVYNTVLIGSQCWMKENLRVTKHADATTIPIGTTASQTIPYRYYPGNDSNNVSIYGYLYNWPAVMHSAGSSSANPSGVQGICPTGWHVPSSAEWTQLIYYVSNQSQYVCGSDNTYIAKSLASDIGWVNSTSACAVGNNPSDNNATNFSTVPAGCYWGNFGYKGYESLFWTTSEYSNDNAIFQRIRYNQAMPDSGNDTKPHGFSVRCLLNEGSMSMLLPTVTTANVFSVSTNTATCGGTITDDGGATITACGVCWSTTHNPTINDNHSTEDGGANSFSSCITGLTANTTYYVRAYATNSVGIAYGNEVSFTTTPTQGATIILEAHNVWGDGSGYQFLLDADATAYGTIIPTSGPLTSSGDADAATYAAFEYKIPQNADGSTYTSNMVYEGSATLSIPAGTYDYCITNPTPGDRIWIAGSDNAREDNFILQEGYSYHFFLSKDMNNAHDTVSITVFNSSLSIPTVTTSVANNISSTSATCGGNVISDGGTAITCRGVCWSTSHNPTISNSHTSDGSGMGVFTSNITGLTSGTTYYVRAYATNNAGTAYGNEVVFTSFGGNTAQDAMPCPGTPTLTDYDGNVYNTVQIGQQCWMKENLRTTHSPDGGLISYYTFSSSDIPLEQRGHLYKWSVVMNGASSSDANPSGVQGICPTGWHVPSDAEWTVLTDFVSSQSEYVCGNNTIYIAKALASTTLWSSSSNTCAVGNNQSANNSTSFGALPASNYVYGYPSFGDDAYFWSATETSFGSAWNRYLHFSQAYVGSSSNSKGNAYSVRCLRD